MPALEYLSQSGSILYLLFVVSLSEMACKQGKYVNIGFCTSLPQDAYSSFQEKTLIHNDVFLGIWKHVVGLIRVSLRQNRALGESVQLYFMFSKSL